MFDLLAANLAERAEHDAVIEGDHSIKYGALFERAEALAGWLHAQGVRRGDRVAIHLHKSIEEVVATFAVVRLGAIFVNIHYQWSLNQLELVVKDCGPRVLITDQRRAADVEKGTLIDALDHVLVKGAASAHSKMTSWSSMPNDLRAPQTRPLDIDLAGLLYTSGSSGLPKGVMLTHLNIVQGARSVASYLRNTRDDRVLGLLPLSFDYGMNQMTTMCLVGGTLVLQPVATPVDIVATLLRHDVTGMAAVPPAWIQVVRYLLSDPKALPSLRYITNSGGKIPDGILAALPQVFPSVQIYLMYGLTEAFRSTFLPPELFGTKMGAIGQAIPNAEIYAVNAEGVCGPGQQGELVHRGSLISKGYWGNAAATNEKIKPCPQLKHLIGDEPVLYSGDIVRVDEDGHFWYVSRFDALIKCSGFRISPTEVEDAIYQSKLIGDVIAFGVADEDLGQVVHVAVSAIAGSAVDEKALLTYCRQKMPTYMVPRKIHLWQGEMPRTGSGKLDRPVIQKAVLSDSVSPTG